MSGAGAAEDGSLPAPPGTPGPSNSSLLRLPPLIDPADVESATPLLISVSDVTLGSMLGRGAFGAVFRGTWQGKEVAVKVRPEPLLSLIGSRVFYVQWRNCFWLIVKVLDVCFTFWDFSSETLISYLNSATPNRS